MDNNTVLNHIQQSQLTNGKIENNANGNTQVDVVANSYDNEDDDDGDGTCKTNEIDNIKLYHEQLKLGGEDDDNEKGNEKENDDKKDDAVNKDTSASSSTATATTTTTYNKADLAIELFYSVLANTHRNKNLSVLIDYEIKDSDGKGRGVFAAQLIPKGTPIKRYEKSKSGIHFVELTEQDCKEVLSKLVPEDRRLFLSYVCSYKPWIHENTQEMIVFDGDDLMFCNHNQNGNMVLDWVAWTYYAGCDIQKGEEIFEDYGHYEDPPWLTKLNKEYGLFDLDTLVKTLNGGQFERQLDNSLQTKDG